MSENKWKKAYQKNLKRLARKAKYVAEHRTYPYASPESTSNEYLDQTKVRDYMMKHGALHELAHQMAVMILEMPSE